MKWLQGPKVKLFRTAALFLIGLPIALQVVPYGRDHVNPPVLQEPKWDSSRTREIFFRSCMNCHSNETVWPWYSNIAPVSWVIQHDVREGRSKFNVSEWGRERNRGQLAAEEVRSGSMPPRSYVLGNPEAKLAPAEREEFIRGLIKTFGGLGVEASGGSER